MTPSSIGFTSVWYHNKRTQNVTTPKRTNHIDTRQITPTHVQPERERASRQKPARERAPDPGKHPQQTQRMPRAAHIINSPTPGTKQTGHARAGAESTRGAGPSTSPNSIKPARAEHRPLKQFLSVRSHQGDRAAPRPVQQPPHRPGDSAARAPMRCASLYSAIIPLHLPEFRQVIRAALRPTSPARFRAIPVRPGCTPLSARVLTPRAQVGARGRATRAGAFTHCVLSNPPGMKQKRPPDRIKQQYVKQRGSRAGRQTTPPRKKS